MQLFSNVRFYVLLFTFIYSVIVYFWVKSTTPDTTIQIIKLTQIYALTAITYLYIALLATPLTKLFPGLPYKGKYIKARRAIGVSVVYFGWLHASLGFFGELGGFPGLAFLEGKYLLAITLSFIALVILTVMASTSFDAMVEKLTFPKWKLLHRFVYLAGIFILIHALLLGSHFQDLSGLIPQILFVALSILFILEAIRFYNYLQTKFPSLPKIG